MWRSLLAVVILLSLSSWGKTGQAAEEGAGDQPVRQTTLTVSYTQYEWWVIRWYDNQIACQVYIDHEGLPTGEEILTDCGKGVYELWAETSACPEAEAGDGDTSLCTGAYLFFIGSRQAEKTITVDLPQPTVTLTLEGCTPTTPQTLCSQIPSLLLIGEEPLPNEHITAIHAIYNNTTINCPGDSCAIQLEPTSKEGTTIEFWADSSFGDTSEHFTARVRVIDTGVSREPGASGWYVDIISSQWQGSQTASCAQTWQAFPPIGGPPAWLSTPEVPELLATETPYYFLAGKLISRGLVDGSECPAGGLLSNGYADACGLEKALPLVQEWQNQFDARIVEVAKDTGVPGQLMKNLFAQESQFWPGVFTSTDHIGLGHLTDNGAEVLLLWNPTFFNQFCPLVLESGICQRGYVRLNSEEQALLRGALAMQAESECTDCPAGIDLTNANFSIQLFAETLLANCEQVGQIVYNASKQTPGVVSDYENLWRFTLANYHAGPGCLSYAIYSAYSKRDPLTWDNVSKYFTQPCQGVIGYVDKVAH